MKNLIHLLPMVFLLACAQTGEQSTGTPDAMEAGSTVQVDAGLMSLFEEVNVVKMHLFGTNEAEPDPEVYPYVGKMVDGEASAFLGEGLQPNGIGQVYACYYTENGSHYILRVPGKYASGDLALAKWDAAAGKLVKVADLAYLACDEGLCQQQDAWLTDLDDNRQLELVLRSHTKEAGNISDEIFEVLTDSGAGVFVKTDEQLASLALKDNYVMQ